MAELTASQRAARDRAVQALTYYVRTVVNKLGVTLTTMDERAIAQIVDDIIDAAHDPEPS